MSAQALNFLLEGLQAAQLALRALLHALGLAPLLHGQPAWPFAWRLAGEMLLMDGGHARRVAATLICLAGAALLMLLALLWRRARRWLWASAAAALLLAPWPQASLLFTPAVPTSFHVSQGGFSAQGIVRGQALYAQHCLRCHGADGRGEGPDAPGLSMWPPTLNGSLLWKRLEGELFWRVRHGMQGRDGRPSMPSLAAPLSDAQVWELLDFLQAQAAGQMFKESGAWAAPVRLPDGPVRCLRGQRPTARSLTGQRLRVVMAQTGAALPADDPRLVTLQLPAAPNIANTANAANAANTGPDPECRMDDPAASASLSLVLGVAPEKLPGYQLLVDRQGWLRAVSQPGQAGWSESDLVCRSGPAPQARPAAPAADGLDALIRRMDAEPVRLLRGGFPH